ncbi:MAG: hypothetical protein GF310_12835 [candidate division Zixibacteria bacterium]|nr:hypothetical protein [candidate division Zixibacteria bacterium]
MRKILIPLAIGLFILISAASSVHAQTDLVISRFNNYLSYMKGGQYDQASTLWLPEYIQEVYKFGIYYTNAPFKYDCNSYLTQNIDDYMHSKFEVTYSAVPSMYNVFKILVNYEVKNGKGAALPREDYYMMKGDDANFYLVPRYWPLLENMQVKEGKYFNLYYFKEKQINDSALAHTDALIEEIAQKIELPPELIERLSMDKLNYFLCENANQIAVYAGKYVPGWHDPAGNFIITNYLPHGTPVADFLIKYKLNELPLYTLPFMEKGLSVYLGGRAGASLDVFGQMVRFSLESDFMKLEDILSASDFDEKTGGPDFAYTLSAYFAGYLMQEFGIEKVSDLYLQLSGEKRFVDTCSGTTVKNILKEKTGKDWAALEKGFMKYFKDIEFGIEIVDKADGDVLYQSGTSGSTIALYKKGDDLILDASANDAKSAVNAAMLLKMDESSFTGDYESSLYEKHFPDSEYERQIYGLIFGPDEIGVYNYLTNEIVAKYITSLADPGGQNEPSRMTFRFPGKLIPGDFDRLKLELIEKP